MANIKVGGIIPFTTIDFPQTIACVLFLQGCPLRCPYCHNQHLLEVEGKQEITWDEVKKFLDIRAGLIEGVVFSGGEPLMQQGLADAVKEVRDMGFYTALHTSGYNPKALAAVLPYLNWIGLDVKAPFSKYGEKFGKAAKGDKVKESLDMIIKYGVPFEVRTTLDPRVLSKDDVLEIANELKECSVKTYAIQRYRPFEGQENPPAEADILKFFEDDLLSKVHHLVPNLIIRAE